jgi:NADH dehydrogenase
MKVSIVGGTGFVGSYIVDRLCSDGHEVRVLTRPGSEHRVPAPALSVPGDVGDPEALRTCLDGADAAIYNIGILREDPAHGVTFDALQRRGAERTIELAEERGVRRFLLMSANGIDAAETGYQTTKLAAEERLKASSLAWTIFRPSVIFGDPRGRMEFCTQLKSDLIESPLPAPLFFSGLSPLDAGGFHMAPVYAEDVAAAFAGSLTRDDSVGQTYHLCGPEALTWKEILRRIAAAAGTSKLMLPAPVMLIAPVAALLGRFSWFPVTRDQLVMLLAGNTCDTDDGLRRLDIAPTRFDDEALGYLRAH